MALTKYTFSVTQSGKTQTTSLFSRLPDAFITHDATRLATACALFSWFEQTGFISFKKNVQP